MAAPTKPISQLPISREKLIAYLTARIEIKKRQQHDYAKQHDYAYASREQQVIDECKKLIAVINGGEV
jgi:hypothetical protein